ncbi:MAG TPA: hypothetical protein VG818_12380 [Gemmatimonadaceae bacterium]|nr:hypothetical protein [Gemmatimonadaceae bacterium]
MKTSSQPERIHVPPVAVAGAALLFLLGVFPAPLLNGDANGYWHQMIRYWAGASILILVPVALLGALPFKFLRRLPASCLELACEPPPLAFAAIVFAVTAGLAAFFAHFIYQAHPTTADEIAQLWHARMIVHGRLSLPVDPDAPFFAMDNVVDQGRWYSQFPIGGPMVLAIGYLVHAPWLVNPLLLGVAAAALYHAVRRAFGERQARAIAVLFALTPSLLMMAASYMNHVPVICLATLALAALAEWERSESAGRARAFAAGIGLALGFMATIRPLDAVVVSAAIGLFQLAAIRGRRERWTDLLVQAAAGAIGVAPLLYANWATTGGAFHFGYEVMWGPAHRLGFHVDPQGEAHTPLRALELAAKYASELNSFAMAWALPLLPVLVIGLLCMKRASRWDALLIGLVAAQVVAYALYWHDGEFIGPRFLFTAYPALVVYAARTPFLVADRFGGWWRHGAPLLMLTCLVVAWDVPMPPYGVWGMATQLRDTRRTFKVDIAGAVAATGIHDAVVFVHEPFNGRLMRRLWALGMPRSQAAQLFARSDACSLLEAVRRAEADSTAPAAARIAMVASTAAPLVSGPNNIRGLDPTIHMSSNASITPACQAELESDARYAGLPFGAALPLEPIDAQGRVDGDIIYVTDLGERNARLRARFGNRRWFRLWAEQRPGGYIRAVVTPY